MIIRGENDEIVVLDDSKIESVSVFDDWQFASYPVHLTMVSGAKHIKFFDNIVDAVALMRDFGVRWQNGILEADDGETSPSSTG